MVVSLHGRSLLGGILSNTTVAQRRAAAGGWTEAMVNAEISRCKPAQIMVNVAGCQGWENPSDWI